MLDHFKDYTDIVGDHPQNLLATTLALNAYVLTARGEVQDWVLEYVDAWRERMPRPTATSSRRTSASTARSAARPAASGTAASTAGASPSTCRRPARSPTATAPMSGWAGLRNAYLLTGDDRYLDVWRKQIDAINAQRRMIDGRWMYPRMYGDRAGTPGTPQPYAENALELYCLSMREDDAKRVRRQRLARLPRRQEPGLSRSGAAARPGTHPRSASRPCAPTRPRPTRGWPTTR